MALRSVRSVTNLLIRGKSAFTIKPSESLRSWHVPDSTIVFNRSIYSMRVQSTPNLMSVIESSGLRCKSGRLLSNFRCISNSSSSQFQLQCPVVSSNSPFGAPLLSKFPHQCVPMISSRGVTKCSLRKGRRKTVKTIINRFYRLDWGGWISTKPGRARHLWKKSAQQKQRLRHHVFRNANECKMMDKMMTKYWIKKKYFVDDPYESYHSRPTHRITKGVQGINSVAWMTNPRMHELAKRKPRKY